MIIPLPHYIWMHKNAFHIAKVFYHPLSFSLIHLLVCEVQPPTSQQQLNYLLITDGFSCLQ